MATRASTVLAASIVAALLAPAASAHAQAVGARQPPKAGMPQHQNIPELENIEIVDKKGVEVPAHLTFTDQAGKPVRLGDYYGDKPVVVVLAYYECPMLCTVVLNGLLAGLKSVADRYVVGRDFRVVVVSFDPRDDAADAAKKREVYLAAYGRDPGVRGWDFLVGSEEQVKQLADTVGFPYRWDPVGKQFAHSAGAFLLTPTGTLSQTLYGIEFPERDLRFALMEASEGKLGSTWDKVLLRCFHWNPSTRGYAVDAMYLMKAGGVLTVVAMWFAFLHFRRVEKKRRRTHMEPVNVRT